MRPWYRVAGAVITLVGLQAAIMFSWYYPSTLSRFTVLLQSYHGVLRHQGDNNTEAVTALPHDEAPSFVINGSSVVEQKNTTTPPMRLSKPERKVLLDGLKKQAPIVCAGLPKTGTTSVSNYFGSLGRGTSTHTYCEGQVRVGVLFERNWNQSKPMLEGCGNFTVYTDIGYADRKNQCFYPFWHSKVDEYFEDYPNGTILLNVRNSTEWTRSIHAWARGSLAAKWRKCKSHPLPVTDKFQDWINFYEAYNERIRNFCRKHPSLKCVEFRTDDPGAGNVLEAEFGIPASFWKHCKPMSGGACRDVKQ